MRLTQQVVAAVLVLLACAGSGGERAVAADGHPTSTAPSGLPLHASDPADDVVATTQPGLSRRLRDDIDLRGLTVERHGRDVRFTIDVRRVDRVDGLTQIFFVDLDPRGFDFGQLDLRRYLLGSDRTIVLEGARAPEGFVSCEDLHASMPGGATRIRVDVPRRCVPATPTSLSVYAQTVPTDDSGGVDQWSHDRLRVPGRYLLGGTAQPATS